MKICYIWIEKFRNFEQFDFNLSSSYKFEYNFEENTILTKNISPLPDNFFGERISDVVGIVGKNGSGKSNAIELICKMLKGPKSSLQTNFLMIVEDKGKLICHFSFWDKKPKANFDISFKEYEGKINPLKVIYFSNVFDERRNEFDKEVSDISVNNLSIRVPFSKRDKTTNFEKQIRLINSKVFSSLNIDLPTRILLTSKVWINRFNHSMEQDIYGYAYEKIKELKTVFRSRLREIIPENKFVHLLRFGFFSEVLNNFFKKRRYRDNKDSVQIEKLFYEFLDESLSFRATEEISEQMVKFLEYLYRDFSKENNHLFTADESDYSQNTSAKTERQLQFLKNLKYFLHDLDFEYNTEGSRNRGLEYFTFDYSSLESKDFVNEYINLFGQSNFFDINWIGISSGHKAYLNLFASIYLELLYTRQTNLLICIDEGDLYLHPMWQIEFFDKLISVLPTIFSGNIQIILTSHSPFLLSDLPNQNITIFDKNFYGSSINGTELPIKTFGANLYDLYSEPFFLKNKVTSDFAYKKIKNLINLVESGEYSESEKSGLTEIVDLVGDDVIRFRLKKILDND